jgi:NADH-quinone oxidoreductase subunit L
VLIVDGIVNGVAKLLGWISSVVRKIQTGLVSNYALMMAIGIVAVVGYMVWKI